jgi:hypothetical protein
MGDFEVQVHKSEGKFGSSCDSGGNDVIAPLVWALYRSKRSWLQQTFGTRDAFPPMTSGKKSEESFWSWMQSPFVAGRPDLSNAAAVFVVYMSQDSDRVLAGKVAQLK